MNRLETAILTLRQRVHHMGLLPRLLIAEALFLALLGLGSLALVRYLADSLQSSRAHEWQLLGQSTAVSIDEMFANARAILIASAAWYRDARATADPGRTQTILDLIARSTPLFSEGVVVVGPNRRILAADREHLSLVGRPFSATPLSEPAEPDAATVQLWSVQTESGGLVALIVPISGSNHSDELAGLIGDQDSPIRRTLTVAVQLGQSGHADLVDQQCRVLASTEHRAFLAPGDHPTFCRQRWSEPGPFVGIAATEEAEIPRLAGPHVMAFVPLTTFPWALEIGTAVDDVYGPSNQLLNGSTAILVSFTTLAILATVLIVRAVVRPIIQLSAIAHRVASGEEIDRISIPWGGEIGELAQSLETMRQHLAGWASRLELQVHQRTAELEQRNAELRTLYDNLQQQEAQREALLGKILTAQEDERQRVSRELHDSIGQALWALAVHLERIQTKSDCPPGLRGELSRLQTLASDSLRDLRRLTVALRPAALDDLGLAPAIRRYAEITLGEAGIGFEIRAIGLDQRLDPTIETVVYRVVQEAINNVARHSHATSAEITVRRDGGLLTARVTDDGSGFDLSGTPGVGLTGMQERAALVGGALTITSQPDQGTTVTLTVPLPGSPEEDDCGG